MSIMYFHTQCIPCLLEKAINQIPKETDERQKLNFTKKVLSIIADAPNEMSAPEIVAQITNLHNQQFGITDNFLHIKQYFNALMLSKEALVQEKIKNADDSLYTALCYAMLGNYIDFGALNNVDENYLETILRTADNFKFETQEYEYLKEDLNKAHNIVYITDNCGEIVMDKLLIKKLLQLFPNLCINVIVRGAPVLNDATIEDALQIGLSEIAPITPNGTNIAGTCINKISTESRKLIDNADIIIAKGQGNFETLRFCGKNIYYLFLCKCNLFSERFGVEPCSPMMLNDLRIKRI